MAVTTEWTVPQTNRVVYSGTSGDSKPADPVSGSLFYETDTEKTYEFYGSAWVQISTGGANHLVLVDSLGNLLGQPDVGVPVVDANLNPVEFAQVTDVQALTYIYAAASSPTKTTLFGTTLPTGATVALIQALNQNVRWRDDGTNPTATVGMQLAAGDQFFYTGDLSAIKFIQETTSPVVDAELNVTLYGQS